ncbi:MAG: hypothetical protein JO057_12910 [Chloroflexi bacterium]|nr:hypothetical protein [Chloroflexota bacterium]
MTNAPTRPRLELGLGLACVALLAIGLTGVPRQQVWVLPTARHAPWCLPDQSPMFLFGFAALAQATDGAMGTPTECEHGAENSNGDTTQKTTTGVATYSWCTNTPGFTRGDEHWVLTADGLEHWIGGPSSPRPLPDVRGPDLRHLCLV